MDDALSVDTVTIVHVEEGPPDDHGVPVETTTRTVVDGCSILPVSASPSAGDFLSPTQEMQSRSERCITAPIGTAAEKGDRVEAGGISWRVDTEPVILQDPLGLISHVEIYVRRWE
jgi:hypothetical protein